MTRTFEVMYSFFKTLKTAVLTFATDLYKSVILLQGCQIDPQGGVYYDIGNADNVDFSYDGSGQILTGTYTASDGARLVLKLWCTKGSKTSNYCIYKQHFATFGTSSKSEIIYILVSLLKYFPSKYSQLRNTWFEMGDAQCNSARS